MKVKTSELKGAALDWAVAKCEGRREPELVNNFAVAWYTWPNTHYSTNWAQGGPIIEREFINLIYRPDINCGAAEITPMWAASTVVHGVTGPTTLIAAMRCYVASKLGDEVEIPEALL